MKPIVLSKELVEVILKYKHSRQRPKQKEKRLVWDDKAIFYSVKLK